MDAVSQNRANWEALQTALTARIDQLYAGCNRIANASTVSVAGKQEFVRHCLPPVKQLINLLSTAKECITEDTPDIDQSFISLSLTDGKFNNVLEKIAEFEEINSVADPRILANVINSFLYDEQFDSRANRPFSFMSVINRLIATEFTAIDKNVPSKKDIERYDASVKKLEEVNRTANDLLNQVTARIDGDRFKTESRWNFGQLVGVIALIIALLYTEYHYVYNQIKGLYFIVDGLSDNQFYLMLLKLGFFAFFSFTIFAALLKACSVFLHNFLINTEKSAALYTYEKFFRDGNNPVARPAATLELIKTVLSARDTGLIKQTVNSDNVDQKELINALLGMRKE